MYVFDDKHWFLYSFLYQICLRCIFFLNFLVSQSDRYSLWCCHVLYIGEKKEYFTKLLCKYTLKDVSFFKMQQAFFVNAPQMKSCFLFFPSYVVFWSKVQWWCNIAFSSHLLSLKKIHALRLFHSISMEAVITALVCLLFFFPSSFPPRSPMPLQQCRPSNECLIVTLLLFFATEHVRSLSFISALWILGNVVVRLWVVVDDTGQKQTAVYNYLVQLDVRLML